MSRDFLDRVIEINVKLKSFFRDLELYSSQTESDILVSLIPAGDRNKPFLVVDERGLILAVNPAWYKLFGYPADVEVVGHPFTIFVPEAKRDDHARAARAMTPKEISTIHQLREVDAVRFDGQTIRIKLRVTTFIQFNKNYHFIVSES